MKVQTRKCRTREVEEKEKTEMEFFDGIFSKGFWA